jgi:hypothetical protein
MAAEMNVMDLLAALDGELRKMSMCTDEEYAQLLLAVSQGPLPSRVEALREQPLQALLLMMRHVESRLGPLGMQVARRGTRLVPASPAPAEADAPPEMRVAAGGAVPVHDTGARRTGLPRCSFCARPRDQVRAMTAGPGGVYICNECVAICVEQMVPDDTP